MSHPDDLGIPHLAVTGWGAARTQLARVRDDEQRKLLTALAANAGVQTAPGLDYVTRLLLHLAAGFDWPVPKAALDQFEINHCERRAKELLAPYVGDARVKCDAKRLQAA